MPFHECNERPDAPIERDARRDLVGRHLVVYDTACGWILTAWRQSMDLAELQTLINEMYSDKDRERGVAATYLWFMEEVGELATALREGTHQEKAAEFADVLAWLVTLANVEGVDLNKAITKYSGGCPGCGGMVCTCDEKP
jgi:NTP pyrophosphatase (non-canonical NTP hydrolase)